MKANIRNQPARYFGHEIGNEGARGPGPGVQEFVHAWNIYAQGRLRLKLLDSDGNLARLHDIRVVR